jgi:dihydrofolate reductase
MITFSVAVSLDGCIAGPNQSEDNPLGEGGKLLHQWKLDASLQGPEDARINAEHGAGVGAGIMGRNMFGPIRGEWDLDWKGWWGPNPPYGFPVFVLTHHPREPLEMEGGTTFHFVTDGFDAALEQARAAAGEQDVQITGGASTIRQALQRGVVDRFRLSHAPVVLGGGEPLFAGVDLAQYTVEAVVASPAATHIDYTV